MAQPQAGYNYTAIGTVGTALLTNRSATLVRVILPGTYIGTLNLYDSSTIAGTSATNSIFGTIGFGLPNTSVGGNVEIGAECKNGLVYSAVGWTAGAVTIIWN